MIKGILQRQHFFDERTIGSFVLFKGDEIIYCCHTCEDPVRGSGDPALVKEYKIHGDTAIPYGTYRAKKTYSPKYCRDVWGLSDLLVFNGRTYQSGFSGIRIHSGNNESHTEGCLLFGKEKSFDRQ